MSYYFRSLRYWDVQWFLCLICWALLVLMALVDLAFLVLPFSALYYAGSNGFSHHKTVLAVQ